MKQENRAPLREPVPPAGRGRLVGSVYRQAVNFVVARLLRDAGALWPANPLLIHEAIDKVERAWALARDPKIAIQLATMYDKANRNDDALVVLRQACHEHPRHALLRHHAAITLLRHGAPEDIQAFFDSVRAIDPDDAFARFVGDLLARYDGWVGQIVSSMERGRSERRPFLMALPIWGAMHVEYCGRFLFATLLAPGNLPTLAKDHAVHIVVFTDDETEQVLRADPTFDSLCRFATIEFIDYGTLTGYQASMQAGYGQQPVYYSDQTLAFYYARNCKFALMSCAHYVALAAGRAGNALVSCLVADIIFNDGAFPRMAAAMAGADAVMVHAIQMHGRVLRPLLEQMRRDDGVLQLASDRCSELVVEHLPPMNLADAPQLADPPLRIAWRVGEGGVLIHGNHYHPFCLRPAAFEHPLKLSIDPVDSRFLDRTSLRQDRIHIVQDAGITALSIDDDPILEPPDNGQGMLSVQLFSQWLCGYWGRLRGVLFRSPLRFGSGEATADWTKVERSALETVDSIVERTAELDAVRTAGRTWRLRADGA